MWRASPEGAGMEDAAMITAAGGGDGGGYGGGGRHDLTLTLMEEQIIMMKKQMQEMKKLNDDLRAENEVLKKSNLQHQDQDGKATWGGGDRGRWMEDGRWDDDPWKHWKGRDEMTTEDNKWTNDDEKWNQKFGSDGKGDRGTRDGWGERSD